MASGIIRKLMVTSRTYFKSEIRIDWTYFLSLLLDCRVLWRIIELLGYLYMVSCLFLGGIYLEYALLLFLLSCLYGSVFSMTAVLLEEWSLSKYPKIADVVKLFLYSLTETIWERPLTVFWRCEGVLQVLTGEQKLGEMKRNASSK